MLSLRQRTSATNARTTETSPPTAETWRRTSRAFLNDVDDIDAFDARTSAAHDRRHSHDDRVASKQDRHRLSNIPLAQNERDEAISKRITGAVERFEAASARDQAEKARHLKGSNRKGDNTDPATFVTAMQGPRTAPEITGWRSEAARFR
jgi:hypothetical protein